MPPTDAPLTSAAAAPPRGGTRGDWTIQPLKGWHLPQLSDPAFLPLLPLLQGSLLLALPDRLLSSLEAPGPRRHRVVVALAPGASTILGLVVSRPTNRRRSCWQICHLRLASEGLASVSRLDLAAALVRGAISLNQSAASWVARASGLDLTRLAALRDNGFQPQLREEVWSWRPTANPVPQEDLPKGFQLHRLHHRLLAHLWHLEQATTPAPLRHLLDRRLEDLRGPGPTWVVLDRSRDQAVACLRDLGAHGDGGRDLELRVHPGRSDGLAPVMNVLLAQLSPGETYRIRTDRSDRAQRLWLEGIGAQAQGDEVVMARSVWRRQTSRHPTRSVGRLEAVFQQLQPGRVPLPTPSTAPW